MECDFHTRNENGVERPRPGRIAPLNPLFARREINVCHGHVVEVIGQCEQRNLGDDIDDSGVIQPSHSRRRQLRIAELASVQRHRPGQYVERALMRVMMQLASLLITWRCSVEQAGCWTVG